MNEFLHVETKSFTIETVSSGGSRIFQMEKANPKGGGVNLLFGHIFPNNCMKMKKNVPGGGAFVPCHN